MHIYLLTIDGKPAGQAEDGYAYFCSQRGKAAAELTLPGIKRRIAAAEKEARAREPSPPWQFGYRMVTLPQMPIEE